MKQYIFLFLGFLLLNSSSFAQFSARSTDWYPGIIILENEEIVKGEISYDFANDLVMCKSEEKISTFGPHQTRSFRYYEKENNVFHNYEVLQIQQNSFYTRKAFFEIVLEGNVKYVRKHNRYPVTQPQEGHLAYRRSNPHLVAYDYYTQLEGELIKSRHFKKEVLPALLNKDQRVAAFIKENKLRTYDIGDQIVLLDYFNHTIDKTKQTAIHKSRKNADVKTGTD
jgi:hypothetical protein